MAKDTKNTDPEKVNSGSENTGTETNPDTEKITLLEKVVQKEKEAKEAALSKITLLEEEVNQEKRDKENYLNQVLVLNEEKESLTQELSELKKAPAKGKKKSGQPLIWKSEDGTEYTFSKYAPFTFNHEGKNLSQEEWVKDDEAMNALVNGKSSFIIKYKK